MTATITTPKAINPAQLSTEMGVVPLRVVGPARDGSSVVSCDVVTVAALTAAVNAHTADPSFTAPPTAAETAYLASQQNATTLRDRAAAALDANATFLALGSPTNVQTLAQVQLLTRECNALIRLLLGRFDSTTGT